MSKRPLPAPSSGPRPRRRGQVILSLEHTPEAAEDCPIGVAAWVDFPEIDLIDELRARLRL